MSYQSLAGTKPEHFMNAFEVDLPLGNSILQEVIASFKDDDYNKKIENCTISDTIAGPKIFNFPPNSDVGKQLLRLVGADVPRRLYEKANQVKIYLINCCGIIVTDGTELSDEDLMSIQFDNQNGVTAHADC